MPRHRMFLDTDNAEEIWLFCVCGWEKLLGFRPSPEVALAVSEFHLNRQRDEEKEEVHP